MTHEERLLVTDLEKWDFREIYAMHKATALKEANNKILEEYGYCLLDHHKERLGNFEIERPGLFRGRGEHPKQGMLRKRIEPEDVNINCSSENEGVVLCVLSPQTLRWCSATRWQRLSFVGFAAERTDVNDANVSSRPSLAPLPINPLQTGMLNKHLSSLMTGLTAKAFRTHTASITLQEQLNELTNTHTHTHTASQSAACGFVVWTPSILVNAYKSDNEPEKLLSYNRASRAVAILCNYQRAPPKNFDKFMANLAKIDSRKESLAILETELKQAKKEAKTKGSSDSKLQNLVERKKAAVRHCQEKLLKLEVQATDKEEEKQFSLGTSKLNFLDPRSSGRCKNMGVQIEKIYKSQRDKFAWGIDMREDDFEFQL
ncbi:LOW QUALITY PROTEIN: DNA topoisomerase 1 [Spinachia spinachia]